MKHRIMKKLLILLTLHLAFFDSFSQADDSFILKRDNVNVEFLGAGIFYSVNYERLYPFTEKSRFGAAIGYLFLPLNVPGHVHSLLPAASFIYGKKHNIEVGASFMFDLSRSFRGGIPSARLGYRYQQNKFLFKAGFTPFLSGGQPIEIVPYGGLALGYCF